MPPTTTAKAATLTLDELTATYPPGLVEFVLMAEADAALAPGLDRALVHLDGPAGELELHADLGHVTAYERRVRELGYRVTVHLEAAA